MLWSKSFNPFNLNYHHQDCHHLSSPSILLPLPILFPLKSIIVKVHSAIWKLYIVISQHNYTRWISFGMTTSDFDNYLNDIPQENMHHAPMLSHCCCLQVLFFFGWFLLKCSLILKIHNRPHQLLIVVSLHMYKWTLKNQQTKKAERRKRMTKFKFNKHGSAIKKTTATELEAQWDNGPHQGQEWWMNTLLHLTKLIHMTSLKQHSWSGRRRFYVDDHGYNFFPTHEKWAYMRG